MSIIKIKIIPELSEGHMNIAGLIQRFIEKFKECAEHGVINDVVIDVHNQMLDGSYLVPVALGFSTPLFILSDGWLLGCHNKTKSDDAILSLYEQWSQHYLGIATSRPKFMSSTMICT